MIKRNGTSLSLAQKVRGVGLFDTKSQSAPPYYYNIKNEFRSTDEVPKIYTVKQLALNRNKHRINGKGFQLNFKIPQLATKTFSQCNFRISRMINNRKV